MKLLAALATTLLLAAGSSPALAEALSKSAERDLAKNGATCEQLKPADPNGATHSCLFVPSEFGRRNFSTEFGRGAYVISEIGHRCKEVEILDDVEFARDGETEPSLRRVSAQCIR